jgi:hypothetical protein
MGADRAHRQPSVHLRQYPKEAGKLKFVGKIVTRGDRRAGRRGGGLAALGVLATAKQAVEDLDRVKRVVQVVGHPRSHPDITTRST